MNKGEFLQATHLGLVFFEGGAFKNGRFLPRRTLVAMGLIGSLKGQALLCPICLFFLVSILLKLLEIVNIAK